MTYYIVGLTISTVVFAFFLAMLRTPIDGQYAWTVVFSLTFLSAAAALIFLLGLAVHVVREIRRRNRGMRRVSLPLELPLSKSARLPDRLHGVRSELVRNWMQGHNTPREISPEPIAPEAPNDGAWVVSRFRKDRAEEPAPQNTKPGAQRLPGFENIKRHG